MKKRILKIDDFEQMTKLVNESKDDPYKTKSIDKFEKAKSMFGCGECSPHNYCDFPNCVKT